MNLLQALQNIEPSIVRIDEVPIGTTESTVGWNSYIYNSNNIAIAGGTSADRTVARRICVAEAFERALFKKICADPILRKDFHIEDFPTSSGFASGFNSQSTRMRALCEGLERWAWSQWIDYGFSLDECTLNTQSSLSTFLLSSFQEYKCFKKTFNLHIDTEPITLAFGVFIGFTETGAFAGSRICGENENPWDHAIIEAHRNFQNAGFFKTNGYDEFQKDNIIAIRANYFAHHKMDAISQITAATKSQWPSPELLLLKEYNSDIAGLFLFRCLFKKFIGWHIGSESRFVY